ncbi:MAG: ParB/RepB/Spo0J family partition protein [Candidatus Lokiarchaeota archaeon]|nr:ParB/RepB/Spo0J family partition protein [Candidatus Lokiarchaeota archaeon]
MKRKNNTKKCELVLSKNHNFYSQAESIVFRLVGVPPKRAIKNIEIDPNKTIGQIKRLVQKVYRLNPVLEINFIYKGKVLPSDMKIFKIGFYPEGEPITIFHMNAGGTGGRKGEKEEKRKEKMEVKSIPIEMLTISDSNIRKDLNYEDAQKSLKNLAEDIQENGLINPLTVVEKDNDEYEIISGLRRYKACKMLGWQTIPCHILQGIGKVEKMKYSLSENVHRADINPIDRAKALKKLYDHYGSVKKVAEKVSLSQSTIWRYLKILGLNSEIQDKIEREDLDIGIKAMGKIAEAFPEGQQEEVIILLRPFTQEEQIEMIKRSEGSFETLKNLKLKHLTYTLSEKVIPYRFQLISNGIKQKLEEFKNISPMTNLIFNNRIGKEFRTFLEKILYQHRLDFEELLHYNYEYRKEPRKLLDLILEDFIKHHGEYNKFHYNREIKGDELKRTIFSTLLELIPLISVSRDSIFYEGLASINKVEMKEKEEIFQKFLKTLKDPNISMEEKEILFEIIEKENFKTFVGDFKELLLNPTLTYPLELKRLVLNRIDKENPRYSPILDEFNPILIELLESETESRLSQRVRQILSKEGLICGNCGKIINRNKQFSEITFCERCNKTYCQECRHKEKYFIKCDFCDKIICRAHETTYEVINLAEPTTPLCDICLDEGTYSNGDVMCKSCQNKISECSNDECGRKLCRKHQIRCESCNKRYCPECAKQYMKGYRFGYVCLECAETEVVECEVCGVVMLKGYDANECSDCGKYLCDEDSFQVPEWCKTYCKDCFERWKDYTFQMKAYGH